MSFDDELHDPLTGIDSRDASCVVDLLDRATDANLKRLEEEQKVAEERSKRDYLEARRRASQLDTQSLTFAANAGEEGKLFGSVTVRDIADAAEAAGELLEKSEVRLPEGPIRELGEYEINVHLHPEVDATLKLAVVAEA